MATLPATAQIRTHTLRQMVRLSGSIFVGHVVDVHGGVDEQNEIVTYTTFDIERPIYRTVPSPVTIKQDGGDAHGLSTRLADMRYFEPGERVLVMFYPVSAIGFTSPIGLYQAVWRVDRNGTVSGVDPAIWEGLDELLARHGIRSTGPVTIDAFAALIDDVLAQEGKR
jgi:hypothetical protein